MRAGGSTVTPMEGMDRLTSTEQVREVDGLESTAEHLKTVLRQENEAYPVCDDYLSLSGNSASDRVSEAWRRKLCEWCFEVVDHFNFDREVVSFALDYLDRTVAIKTEAAQEPLPKREFQLLAVTALYMAIKIHGETDDREGPRRKLRISAFVELSRGFFSIDVIESMERTILESLKWRVNPPTCLRFTASYLRLCPRWGKVEHSAPHATVIGGIFDFARYLTELSVCVSAFSFNHKTSVTAYASILVALEALQHSLPLPYPVRVVFLNNIAEATGLFPNNPDVHKAYTSLKELCPSLVDGDLSPEFLAERMADLTHSSAASLDAASNRVSPVSVMDAAESPRSRRKRSRSAVDEARGSPDGASL